MATKKDIAATGSLFADTLDEGVISGNELLSEGTFVEDKETLVGVPMLLMEWTHAEGQGGLVRVDVVAILSNDEKVTFNDFGSGIRLQLEDATRQMNAMDSNAEIPLPFRTVPKKPVYLPKGLRVSKYSYEDKIAGTKVPASTYYLNSAS